MTESHRPAQPTGPPPRQGEPRRDVLREQAAWLQQQQPAYLIAALGRPGSRDWQMLALEIERYRRAAGVTSRACALGGVPGSPEEAGRWDRLADRIAAYQGVRTLTFDDLCVFPAQAAHRREQAALSRLEDHRWLGVMSPRETQTIARMPTLVLRRHVSFAAGLLAERPAERSARLIAVQAELAAARAYQADHKAAVEQAGARRRLQATIGVHGAALARLATVQRRLERQQAELRQQASRRLRWDSPLPAPAGDRTAQRL